ncbi:MAG: pyridoxal kinase [Pseudomonadota bacterium]
MAHILALSSWVAHGHVGLSAAAPVLQILGHTVTQLPTVQLSNHPGFDQVAGREVEIDTLHAIIGAVDANGWLDTVDTILTGYLPSAGHVDVAVGLIERFEAMRPRVIVDPVLGDSPKGLYIARDAAEALRDRLVPKADIMTPNAFELSWLTDRAVDTPSAAADAARDLERRAPGVEVLVTSAPFEEAQTGVLAVTPTRAAAFRTPGASPGDLVPQGVGDAFSALIAAGMPTGRALGCLQTLIEHSLGAAHLRIAQTAPHWTNANPIEATLHAPLTGTGDPR